jgi:hypothetical protein
LAEEDWRKTLALACRLVKSLLSEFADCEDKPFVVLEAEAPEALRFNELLFLG